MVALEKKNYSMEDLKEITRTLRGENGCQWDRVQTHDSIRKNLIEETYEACEAIDCKDADMLREELGDVLWQVLFHVCIEEEVGSFTFDDVIADVCEKLIVRHPHVFSDVEVSGTTEIISNWDAIKNEIKGYTTASESLLSVPKQLPALMRTQKVQQRVKKAVKQFEYNSLNEVFGSLEREVCELKQAVEDNHTEGIADEVGNVMFATVNVARYLGHDAEELLTASCNKFVTRFCKIEELAMSRGIDLATADDDVLDILWMDVKGESK